MGADGHGKRRVAAREWFRAGWARLISQVERETNRRDGEDLLQDAYVRMVSARATPANTEAYLVRAAVNRANDAYRMDEVRERNHADRAMDMLRDTPPLQDEVLIMQSRLRRVAEGIDQLPPRTQEVFLLQRMEGLKYREIAARLAISQSAVEKHMTKAIAFLGDWMKDW